MSQANVFQDDQPIGGVGHKRGFSWALSVESESESESESDSDSDSNSESTSNSEKAENEIGRYHFLDKKRKLLIKYQNFWI